MTKLDYRTISFVKNIYAISNEIDLTKEEVKIIYTFVKQESNFNDKILGDGGKAVGYLQLHSVMVTEANNILGFERFKINDRFNAQISIIMFMVVQRHYNPSLNLKVASYVWNSGTIDTSHNKCKKYYSEVLNKFNKLEIMENNSVNVDLEKYLQLHDFKKEVLNNMIPFTCSATGYDSFSFYTKDEFVKSVCAENLALRKENSEIRKILGNERLEEEKNIIRATLEKDNKIKELRLELSAIREKHIEITQEKPKKRFWGIFG